MLNKMQQKKRWKDSTKVISKREFSANVKDVETEDDKCVIENGESGKGEERESLKLKNKSRK